MTVTNSPSVNSRTAFEIDGEMKERGCRYIIVGRKTSQSLRRVPLRAAVLPFLPRKLEGRLFPGDPRAASKRLNRFLNEIGIGDRRKVVHSLAIGRKTVCGLPVAPKIAVGQF
jgi:hypothetical protein